MPVLTIIGFMLSMLFLRSIFIILYLQRKRWSIRQWSENWWRNIFIFLIQVKVLVCFSLFLLISTSLTELTFKFLLILISMITYNNESHLARLGIRTTYALWKHLTIQLNGRAKEISKMKISKKQNFQFSHRYGFRKIFFYKILSNELPRQKQLKC